MNSNNRNTLLLLGLLLVVLAISYPFLTKQQDATDASSQDAAVADAESLLNRVQAISFDFSVFQTPEFTHLKDITTPLPNLPVGRSNPFAAGK